MSVFAMAIILYMLIGALAGFLAGLFGIGGGIILVPGFYYTLSWLYPEGSQLMQISIGTALATIIVTGLSSVRAHAARQNIKKDILFKLGPGVAIGSLLSAVIADILPSDTLKSFFAIMIMGLAVLMIIGPEKISRKLGRKTEAFPNYIFSSISGAVIGCLSGLMGIGGATLSVPFMSSFHVEIKKAVGTASAIGLFIAVPSAMGFILMGLSENTGVDHTIGYIYWPAWISVICCSSITAIYGAKMAHELDPVKLKKIFAIFMVVIAISMMGDELF